MFELMKYRWLYLFISLLVIVPGIVSLLLFGLKPALDFTGGSLWEVAFTSQKTDASQLEALVESSVPVASITQVDEDTWQIKSQHIDAITRQAILERMKNSMGQVRELRFESIGPSLGKELVIKTAIAIVLSSVLIGGYISRRFSQLRYGLAAILAVIHDCLVLLGLFSILGHFWQVEVDAMFLAAALMTISFSLHDTIVVFDRVRELSRLHPKESTKTIINAAVWQTVVRSLNNSITIILMLLSLTLLGGESIRWFALALLVGAITGTYSSTFIAVPLLLTVEGIGKKFSRVDRKWWAKLSQGRLKC